MLGTGSRPLSLTTGTLRHAHPLHNWILDPRNSPLSLPGAPSYTWPWQELSQDQHLSRWRLEWWRSVGSSLASISLQRKKKKRKNGPKDVDFAQSCWYQDSAGCLQAFLLHSGQPGLSSRTLVYFVFVCVFLRVSVIFNSSLFQGQGKNHVAVSDYARERTSFVLQSLGLLERPLSPGCLWPDLYLLLEYSSLTTAFLPTFYSRKWAVSYTAASL